MYINQCFHQHKQNCMHCCLYGYLCVDIHIRVNVYDLIYVWIDVSSKSSGLYTCQNPQIHDGVLTYIVKHWSIYHYMSYIDTNILVLHTKHKCVAVCWLFKSSALSMCIFKSSCVYWITHVYMSVLSHYILLYSYIYIHIVIFI